MSERERERECGTEEGEGGYLYILYINMLYIDTAGIYIQYVHVAPLSYMYTHTHTHNIDIGLFIYLYGEGGHVHIVYIVYRYCRPMFIGGDI